MRKLVTLREVTDILPIANADRLEVAVVDGWKCVVEKDKFKRGDFALYFEVDSLLPRDNPDFAFMEPRGFRVKTIKLRGQISQGLLMPMSILNHLEATMASVAPDDTDLSELLGVTKYEPPLPLGGEQAGPFPGFIRKTDQERVQNIPDLIAGKTAAEFEITEKLDGTSCTVFWCEHTVQPSTAEDGGTKDRFGVCSRNWEMQLDDDNAYTQVAKKNDLQTKLAALGRGSLAIQGEIIGPGIQGNKYKLAERRFFVFDIFDIDEGQYLTSVERHQLTRDLELAHVPIIHIDADWPLDVDRVVEFADGRSNLCGDARREGVVFKMNQPDDQGHFFSFKAISNKWLLKHE